MTSLHVLKFGGSCLKTSASLENVLQAIEKDPAKKKIIVVSALSGVTDLLIEASVKAAKKESTQTIMRKISYMHEKVINEAVSSTIDQNLARGYISDVLTSLEELLAALSVIGFVNERIDAHIRGFGEMLSAPILAAYLSSNGIKSKAITQDAVPIITNNDHLSAKIAIVETEQKCSKILNPLLEKGIIPVVCGFVGFCQGERTTLGRGGSDLTAAMFASIYNAENLILFKDVDGIMSADPKVVNEAYSIKELSYKELEELGRLGSKVVYSESVAPVVENNIPIIVKSIVSSESQGTKITSKNVDGIKSIITLPLEKTDSETDSKIQIHFFEKYFKYSIASKKKKTFLLSLVGTNISQEKIATLYDLLVKKNVLIFEMFKTLYSYSFVVESTSLPLKEIHNEIICEGKK